MFGLVSFMTVAMILLQVSTLLFMTDPVSAQIDDQGSGWAECNGWATNPNYNKIACRERAMKRANGTDGNGTNFLSTCLINPPSFPNLAGGTDQQWHDWGLGIGSTCPSPNQPGHFLSYGTSCGIGPTAKECIPPTATPTTKPSATPTTKPSATPTTKPSATPTTKPSATPTVRPTKTVTPTPTTPVTVTVTPSVVITVTPSITNTPVVTPTPDVKGEDSIFGFNLRKTVNGKQSYRVGEMVTFTVSMENSGTEKITKINMRDVYSTNMRVEAVYLIQNGQRRNVTSQFFANDSEREGGNILPRDPQSNDLLDLTDFTGDLNPGEKLTFEFIFKAVTGSPQVCNQAHASSNGRSEISSQKVCISINAVIPVTD